MEIQHILDQHLKYNADNILSKEELQEMERNNSIQELCNKLNHEELKNVENLQDLRKRLKSMKNLEKYLAETMTLMDSSGKNVDRIQHQTISDAAEMLDSATHLEISSNSVE